MGFWTFWNNSKVRFFPNESIEARRCEILQRFIVGNSRQELRQMLAGNYADERYVTNTPTVEAPRITVLRPQQ